MPSIRRRPISCSRRIEFEADDDARVLILTGAGEDAFCAGADLKSVAAAMNDQGIAEQWLKPRPHGPLGFTRSLDQADDRGDLRLCARRRARAGALVRPRRNRDREARIPRAPLGRPADRRRDQRLPRRGDGPRARHDPQRSDRGRGGGARDRPAHRGRPAGQKHSSGRSRWPRGSPHSRRRRCSPTVAPRLRDSGCSPRARARGRDRRSDQRRRSPGRRPLRQGRGRGGEGAGI